MTDNSDNQITAFYPGAMSCPGNPPGKEPVGGALAIVAPGFREDMRNNVAFYKANSIPYIYDPGQQIPDLDAQDLSEGISGAKVFISNDYELSLVMQKTGFGEHDILAKSEMLITTLGGKGSVLKTRGAVYSIPPAKPDNVSDPTGAGDAFRAGLIKGLASKLPLEAVGRLAATVAVYSVEKYGTQTHEFTLDRLKERYKQNFGQELPL
jgi:adenosine kinase